MVPGNALTSSAGRATESNPTRPPASLGEQVVVVLAGPGESSDIIANFLVSRGSKVVFVLEDAQSRIGLARRRAKRMGWGAVVGQILFVTCFLPLLRRRARGRRTAILLAAAADTGPRCRDHHVESVNSEEVIALLHSLRPAVVVVHGTRIISARVLEAAGCPVINLHAGITPRYRGVHGGYWALVEQHPEWVGTTLHLVDPGIDTGGILGQVTFEVSTEDTIATYPDLHLVHGLPLLAAQMDKVKAGTPLEPVPSIASGSRLYYHPTIWGYAWRRLRDGVR